MQVASLKPGKIYSLVPKVAEQSLTVSFTSYIILSPIEIATFLSTQTGSGSIHMRFWKLIVDWKVSSVVSCLFMYIIFEFYCSWLFCPTLNLYSLLKNVVDAVGHMKVVNGQPLIDLFILDEVELANTRLSYGAHSITKVCFILTLKQSKARF